jgi:release factor glutamine methyltransferase
MQDTIQKIRQALSDLYPDSEISGFTRLIIEDITGLSMPLILSDKNIKITEAQELKIQKIIERLQAFEPIQYILEQTEFYGLPFQVNNNVLIPRPETEELVEKIINDNSKKSVKILDIGTGSGCIAISLKKYLPNSSVDAWDISFKALDVAVLNSKINSVDVTFKRVDVLSEYPNDGLFDIIVSNPPYVLEAEKADMEHNVLDYEPHTALFVPDREPLLFYERIADIAQHILKPNGYLYFEINSAKGQETSAMLKQKGFTNIELIQDISGKDRMVKATYSRQS